MKLMRPAVISPFGGSSRRSAEDSVDFPQPDSPTMPRISPGCHVKADVGERRAARPSGRGSGPRGPRPRAGAPSRLRHLRTPASLGSTTSRSVSPRKVQPRVTTISVRPAQRIGQGCSRTRSKPSWRMTPQEGVGGGTPRPRKERPASSVIAAGRSMASRMKSGAITFGRMWTPTMRQLPRSERARGLDELVLLRRQHERARHPGVVRREGDGDHDDHARARRRPAGRAGSARG